MRVLKWFLWFLLAWAIIALCACSTTPSERYIPSGYAYPTDSVGNIQYHKGGWTTVNGTAYRTDSIGNVQYHKGGVKTK